MEKKKWIVHLVVVSGKLVGGNSVGTSDWGGVIVAGKLFSVKTVGGVVVVVGAAALGGGGGGGGGSVAGGAAGDRIMAPRGGAGGCALPKSICLGCSGRRLLKSG